MATDSKIQAIERATGRSWSDWLAFMDSIGAKDLDHHAIATKVLDELVGTSDNPGWWTQSVTNTYEQYIGRRVPGQRPDGTFRLSVSKSTALSMSTLMEKWTAFAAKDAGAQAMITAQPRISGTSNRITWRAKGVDNTSITVISEPKPNGTASLVVQHGGLVSQEINAQAKEQWVKTVQRFLTGLAA